MTVRNRKKKSNGETKLKRKPEDKTEKEYNNAKDKGKLLKPSRCARCCEYMFYFLFLFSFVGFCIFTVPLLLYGRPREELRGMTSIFGHKVFVEPRYPYTGMFWKVERILEEGRSMYQNYRVFEDSMHHRYLSLDDAIQFSNNFEYVYHELMAHSPIVMFGDREIDVLILGAGDGGIVTQVMKHDNVQRVYHVEIDEKIPQLAIKYFPDLCAGFKDYRHTLHIGDAKIFLRETKDKFHVVIADFTDFVVSPDGFWTKPFYEDLFSTLTDDGIFIINVGSHQMENVHPSYSGWDYGIRADLQRLLPEFEETLKFVPLRLDNPDYGFYGGLMIYKNKNVDPLCVDWGSFLKKDLELRYFSRPVYDSVIETDPTYAGDVEAQRVLTLNYNLRLYDCKKDITDKDVWNKMIDELNNLLLLTELDRTEHVFPNGGISILSLLAESHISLHTWPEYESAVLDIRTCKLKFDPIPFQQTVADPFECQWSIKTFQQ